VKRKTRRSRTRQAVAALPVLCPDRLYDPTDPMSIDVRERINTAAGALLQVSSFAQSRLPLRAITFGEFAQLETRLTTAAFQLGVEYGLLVSGGER
jgi:hypothetical protein